MTRIALVTGAASGAGRAIAARLLEDDFTIAAVDIDGDALERTKDESWGALGERVSCLSADVGDADAAEGAVRETMARFGRIDALVNNAGITGGPGATTVHETTVADFDAVMGVNIRGPFLLCRAALPSMLAAGAGTIVNIASVAGTVAFPGRAAYNVSKGALIQLTRSIAVDYAAKGIRCNAVCPGMLETPMTKWRLDQPELREQILSRIPQREIGTPGDVAAIVAFLVSEQARYFNGAALTMDGAYSAL